jgi:hypothetical protein
LALEKIEKHFRKDEVDHYVESIYSHLPSAMGSWQSESTVKTELSRIKVTLRHLFPDNENEDEEITIDLTELTWKDWLQAFERLSERSIIAYGNRVSKFLRLDDPRLAIPVKNAVSYHLAMLRNQPPPALQKVPQPLFPDKATPSISPLSAKASAKRASSISERRFISLDEILRSVTDESTEDEPLKVPSHEEIESPGSPFDRLRQIFRRKK